MILSTNTEEHEFPDAAAYCWNTTVDGKNNVPVTRVDSEKLTFDVHEYGMGAPERRKARYVGIFIRERRVDILSALPVKDQK